jgi:hypothetical protein
MLAWVGLAIALGPGHRFMRAGVWRVGVGVVVKMIARVGLWDRSTVYDGCKVCHGQRHSAIYFCNTLNDEYVSAQTDVESWHVSA